jgi:hypothetical protein
MDIIDANPGIKSVADDAAKTALTASSWEGRLVYQLDNNKVYKYNGATWDEVGTLEALTLADFAEDSGSHSGLDFGYKAGKVRDDNVVNDVSADVVTLADDDTNYVEVLPSDGTVSANVVGFTAGSIPLFEVVTASGAIDTVTDKRAFMGAGGGVTGSETRGISFCISGVDLAITQKIMFLAPCALTILGGKIEVLTAPTDADLICDIHKEGTTIFTTQGNRPTITDGGYSAAIVAPDVTSVAEDDLLELHVDQVGSTVKGKDLALTLKCEVV